MNSSLTEQQLTDIEAVIRAAIPLGADIAPETAAALLAEVRRLQAVVAATHTKTLATEADDIVKHCPDHGPQDQARVWMDCHCAVADDFRRRAAAAPAV